MQTLWLLLIEQGWGAAILRGSLVTIVVGLLGMLIGLAFAIPFALVRWTKIAALSQAIHSYTLLVRSIPGLLVIYLLFFGSVESVDAVAAFFGFQEAAKNAYPFIMGTASIAIISCAYSVEVLRGALQAIPTGLLEASKSLSLPRGIVYMKIIAPLMFRYALPGLNNVWQSTIKDTSLISVVGLEEVMRLSSIAAGTTRSPLFFYMIAGCVFLAITGVSQISFTFLESRLGRGFKVS
ncbi:ABC transporter permease [Rhizobium tubonense]|uniref:ABC transporter permease n=1 Tax=Rhizobium tubonense TaxID=484088 RepID=A0A2W4CVH5_9HYPH|nr:ABC transporter permease subunit [Rhizobium tubonense]PZM14315.1 ABC transporter permease [Rhizobium tubonense]